MNLFLSSSQTVAVSPAPTAWPAGTHTSDTPTPAQTPGPDVLLEAGETVTISHNNHFLAVTAIEGGLRLTTQYDCRIETVHGNIRVLNEGE